MVPLWGRGCEEFWEQLYAFEQRWVWLYLVNENVSLKLKGNSVFCLTCSLSPEFSFSYFLGNLPRLCERKTKSFWYCMGETQISQLKLFKILFYFLFFVVDRLLLSADVPSLFLNHISCDLTLNCNFILKSSLTAMGIFISRHLIFQVEAFLLLIIHFSRFFLTEMTVNLALWLLFFFLTSYWWNLLYLRWCNGFGLFISNENSQA